jgi:hypothetical protein
VLANIGVGSGASVSIAWRRFAKIDGVGSQLNAPDVFSEAAYWQREYEAREVARTGVGRLVANVIAVLCPTLTLLHSTGTIQSTQHVLLVGY